VNAPWLWLFASILAEVIATSALKMSNSFTRLWPTLVVIAGYAFTFWGMTFSLKAIPIAVVYAVWSALGTVGVLIVGRFVFGESLGWQQYVGAFIVVGGVVLMSVGRQVA
jgi:small multidrug resistance pump